MNEDLFKRARRPSRLGFVVLAGVAVVFGAASCTVSEKTPFILGNDLPDGSTSPGLVSPPEPDAGDDDRAALVEYCPSDRCPDGYTTCPSSLFRCDVNLKTDRGNCGACGSACPSSNGREIFECVEGKCVLHCGDQAGNDCDGIVDNGCETPANDPKNCGACGNECNDPANPCIRWDGVWGCGCPSGHSACGPGTIKSCVVTDTSDANCGGCNNVCNPAGDGGAAPDNMYYGCLGGECGRLKCRTGYASCDGDLGNGCETLLTTDDDCGSCGNACGAGESCQRDYFGNYVCMCPPGLTLCNNRCVDVATDVFHCGSCGAQCEDFTGGIIVGASGKTSVATCVYGTCALTCVAGRADCNGNRLDGCETNTNNDPQNCGGCGAVCDAVAGQACVGGRCAVEPCDQIDAGPVAK
ncbi:MAG: hypothetical protein KF850_39000 [Labilithrix sp.]|nr:hypothetical protein [Labilithrix sp.]